MFRHRRRRPAPTSVTFVSPRFHTNESQLVAALIANGMDVVYLAHECRYSEDHSMVRPIEVGYFPQSASEWSDAKKLGRSLYPPVTVRIILAKRPDVVVLKGFRLANVLLATCLRLCGVCVVVHVQRPLGTRVRGLRAVYWRLHGRLVVTPVREVNDERTSAEGPFRQRWQYAPFVARPDPRGEARAYRRGGVLRVLVVAKFTPRKNIVAALEAIAHLTAEGCQVLATIAGTVLDQPYFETVRALAERMPNVRLLVDVPYANMADLYLANDVLVLPSQNEPASYSQLEAMRYGLAVVVGPDNGTAAYVVNGVTGVIMGRGNVAQEVHDALTWMASTGMLERCGRNGYIRLEREHTADPFIEALRAMWSGRVNERR